MEGAIESEDAEMASLAFAGGDAETAEVEDTGGRASAGVGGVVGVGDGGVSGKDWFEESVASLACASGGAGVEGVIESEDAETASLAFAGGDAMTAEAVERIVQMRTELETRCRRLEAGGEIPCHFTTLTTAIYQWDDLRLCLENYEKATSELRGGGCDPLEGPEAEMRRKRPGKFRVLRYPGVVAWFTAYKMELFYKHVLRYEDGEGVFEWGAGGIMHLHSINFGSQMPRIDPEAVGLRVADRQRADLGAAFARVREEYLTDWSLGKMEKWFFWPSDDAPARKRENISPVHTDSESDGSEADEEIVNAACFPALGREAPEGVDAVDARVSAVGPLAADEDYVRLFPSPTEMVYEKTAAGGRKTVFLTEAQRRCLVMLNKKLEGKELQRGALVEPCSMSVPATALGDVPVSATVSRSVPVPARSRGEVEGRSSSVPVPATSDPWHPCQITVEEKKLLMTNNCQLVWWVRRKWYRRLTETCNMHDRHGGAGLEVAPVWVDAEGDEVEMQAASSRTLGGRVDVKILTQNMRQLDPDRSFWEGLEAVQGCDALCLQEVTPSCARVLSGEARSRGYEVLSPMFRGRCSAEGFDVAILLKCEGFRRLRVCVVELGPSERCLLRAVAEIKKNGAVVAIGTVYLTAAREEHATRAAELSVALRALEELPVDGCIVAGDFNMRNQENLPVDLSAWRDAWVECGAVEERSGTWCPDEMDPEDAAVRQWRFDRVYFLSKKTVLVEVVSGVSVPTTLEAVEVEGCSSESAAVGAHAEGELLDASVPTMIEEARTERVGGVSLPTSAGARGGGAGCVSADRRSGPHSDMWKFSESLDV